HLIGREFTFIENAEHFATDIAGCSDHCDFVTHRSHSAENAPARLWRKGRAALPFEKRHYYNLWAPREHSIPLRVKARPFMVRPGPGADRPFRRPITYLGARNSLAM